MCGRIWAVTERDRRSRGRYDPAGRYLSIAKNMRSSMSKSIALLSDLAVVDLRGDCEEQCRHEYAQAKKTN